MHKAQLGGSCTLIGSSHCLVARESVDKDLYEMSFFDLSYSGAILSFATFFIMALSLPFLASSATPETRQDDAAETVSRENLYAVNFSLWPQSPYVGMDFAIASMQLKRLSGVQDMWRKTEEHDCLTGSEEVCFLVDEIGVISLRQMKGLRIASEDNQPINLPFESADSRSPTQRCFSMFLTSFCLGELVGLSAFLDQDALRALGMERERRHLYVAKQQAQKRIFVLQTLIFWMLLGTGLFRFPLT